MNYTYYWLERQKVRLCTLPSVRWVWAIGSAVLSMAHNRKRWQWQPMASKYAIEKGNKTDKLNR